MSRDSIDRVKLIQQRLLITQNRWKSYENRYVRNISFAIGEKVLLKVSPTKGVMRFERWGNLNPRYIRSFHIQRIVWEVAFELPLPSSFSAIHSVFHISKLRRYIPDDSNVLQCDAIEFDDHLTFVEEQDIDDCGRETFLLLRIETSSI